MVEVRASNCAASLQSKRAECSILVASRKRKLRELFIIATELDLNEISRRSFGDHHAPAAEVHFLRGNEILQDRRFNESAISIDRRQSAETLRRFLGLSATLRNETIDHIHSTPTSISVNGTPPVDLSISFATTETESPGPTVLISAAPADPTASEHYIPVPDSRTKRESVSEITSAVSAVNRTQATAHVSSSFANGHTPPAIIADQVSDAPHLSPRKSPPGIASQDGVVPGNCQYPCPGIDTQKPCGPGGVVETSDAGSRLPPIRHYRPGDPGCPEAFSSPRSHSAASPTVRDTAGDHSLKHFPPVWLHNHVDTVPDRFSGPGVTPILDPARAPGRGICSQNGYIPPNPADGEEDRVVAASRVEEQLLEESAAAARLASDTRPAPAPSTAPYGHSSRGSRLEAVDSGPGTCARTDLHSLRPMVPAGFADCPPPESSSTVRLDSGGITSTTGNAIPLPAAHAPSRARSPQLPPPQLVAPICGNLGFIPDASPANRPALPAPTESSANLRKDDVCGEASLTGSSTSQRQALSLEPLVQRVVTPGSRLSRSKRARRKIPIVAFGRRKKLKLATVQTALVAGGKLTPAHLSAEDYFTTLFVQGFTLSAKWMKPIDTQLNQSHKTLSTPDVQLSILEQQACRVLRRVYNLQQHDKWSLRQPKRCPEPMRPPSHWDVLLTEMKWMRTDFRGERKWKRSAARSLAFACAEWVAGTSEQRKLLQVRARPLPTVPRQAITASDPHAIEHTLLNPQGVQEACGGPVAEVLPATVAPTAIFNLADDEFAFTLGHSGASDQLLAELPLYGAPLEVPEKPDLALLQQDPDSEWRRAALPLTRYIDRPMVPISVGPPSKRSRYQYMEEESSDNEDEQGIVYDNNTATALAADSFAQAPSGNLSSVGLFNPDMQVTRDRLHAGHQFRPPTEHPMPLQSFYETRSASQWTWAEDDELKTLVREYSYNWSLISSMLSAKSLFSSGPERRTPWECFERWVHLEGLPNDMLKTQYFKTYQHRLDAAQTAIAHKNQSSHQVVGQNGAVTPVPRKRPTTSVRVERRRNQKHLTLIDAMRKLAKKREATVQKQQQAASLATLRKANEAQQSQSQQPQLALPRGPHKTPRDYSLMRFERDQQLTERMAQYAQKQQQEAQRKAQMLATRSQVAAAAGAAVPSASAGSAGIAGVAGPGPGAQALNSHVAAQMAAQMAAAAGGVRSPQVSSMTTQLGINGHPRSRMTMSMGHNNMAAMQQAHSAGALGTPVHIGGIPPAPAQAGHRLPMPTTAPSTELSLLLQAQRIQSQQRSVQMQQQQKQQQQQHHPHPHGQQNQPLIPVHAQAQQQVKQPAPSQSKQQQLQQTPLQSQQGPQQLISHPPVQQSQAVGQAVQQPQRQKQQQQHHQHYSHSHGQQAQSALQGQQRVVQNSPTGMRATLKGTHSHNQQSYVANGQALMTFNGHSGGVMTSPANLAVGSPASQGVPQQASSAALAHVEAQIRAKAPQMAADQVRKLATATLEQRLVQQRNNAMSAAAGSSPKPMVGSGGTPHQYAQILLAQQQQAATAVQGQNPDVR